MTIWEMRKAAGLTQAALANYIGVNKRTLEGWESNHPCPEYIRALIQYKLTKERKITMFNIYFVKTGSENNVVFEQDGKWFVVADPDGYNVDTKVDLYSENAVDELKAAYADIDSFNPFADNYNAAEFKGENFTAEVEDIAESITLIREVVE